MQNQIGRYWTPGGAGVANGLLRLDKLVCFSCVCQATHDCCVNAICECVALDGCQYQHKRSQLCHVNVSPHVNSQLQHLENMALLTLQAAST